jgi:hypothetical protein
MYSLTVSESLLGSRYVSGSRHFEGVIVQAEKVPYEPTYKICVRLDGFPIYRWATIEVVEG